MKSIQNNNQYSIELRCANRTYAFKLDSSLHTNEWIQAFRYLMKMARVKTDIQYLPSDEEILTLYSKRKGISQTIVEVLIDNGGLQKKFSQRKSVT